MDQALSQVLRSDQHCSKACALWCSILGAGRQTLNKAKHLVTLRSEQAGNKGRGGGKANKHLSQEGGAVACTCVPVTLGHHNSTALGLGVQGPGAGVVGSQGGLSSWLATLFTRQRKRALPISSSSQDTHAIMLGMRASP